MTGMKMPRRDMMIRRDRLDELDRQPCTGAEDCMVVEDKENYTSGCIPKFTEVQRDDMLIRWDGLDGQDTQACTGDGDCMMIKDGRHDDDDNENRDLLMSKFNDGETKGNNFRERERMTRAVKRLQSGPRTKKNEDTLKKKTGNILRKIVMKIQGMIPEIRM